MSESNLTYPVVDTGQTAFYDNRGQIDAPGEGDPFYGQDAQYQGPQPSYRDNGDGTVTDLNTGLMWQQGVGAEITYEEALALAEDSTLGGYDDWRLPTVKELYSLMLFSGDLGTTEANSVPYLDTDSFDFVYGDVASGKRLIDAQYWSSTEYVGETMNGEATVFGVNFADGRVKGYGSDTDNPSGGAHFVRLVRGNEEYGENDFVDNGDGTITDEATGLMWTKADSGQGMTWEEALAYAENCVYDGYDDWRLPNIKELQSIIDYSQAPDATDPNDVGPALADVFDPTELAAVSGDADYPYYWSSTTLAVNGQGSEATYMAAGEAWGYLLNPATGQYVLANVHGAGAQRSDPKTGEASDYPNGRGPQNDQVRIENYVFLVRDETEALTTGSVYAAYFDEATYLQNKADQLNAQGVSGGWTAESVAEALAGCGLTPLAHFQIYGAFEVAADGGYGIDPSAAFDVSAYYAGKMALLLADADPGNDLSLAQVAAAFAAGGLDPLAHYALYGQDEGLSPVAVNL